MWPDILKKAKQGGLNVIQTYVFWNIHEPVQGKVTNMSKLVLYGDHEFNYGFALNFVLIFLQWEFEGNYDLVKFVRMVQENGMYVTLRVGPFIQAEWNHGYIHI